MGFIKKRHTKGGKRHTKGGKRRTFRGKRRTFRGKRRTFRGKMHTKGCKRRSTGGRSQGKRHTNGSKKKTKHPKKPSKPVTEDGKRVYYILQGEFKGFQFSDTKVGRGLLFVEGRDNALKMAQQLYGSKATILKCLVKRFKMAELGHLALVAGDKKAWLKKGMNSARYTYRCELGEMQEIVVASPWHVRPIGSLENSGSAPENASRVGVIKMDRKSSESESEESSSESDSEEESVSECASRRKNDNSMGVKMNANGASGLGKKFTGDDGVKMVRSSAADGKKVDTRTSGSSRAMTCKADAGGVGKKTADIDSLIAEISP